jgi:hypothetical protein
MACRRCGRKPRIGGRRRGRPGAEEERAHMPLGCTEAAIQMAVHGLLSWTPSFHLGGSPCGTLVCGREEREPSDRDSFFFRVLTATAHLRLWGQSGRSTCPLPLAFPQCQILWASDIFARGRIFILCELAFGLAMDIACLLAHSLVAIGDTGVPKQPTAPR